MRTAQAKGERGGREPANSSMGKSATIINFARLIVHFLLLIAQCHTPGKHQQRGACSSCPELRGRTHLVTALCLADCKGHPTSKGKAPSLAGFQRRPTVAMTLNPQTNPLIHPWGQSPSHLRSYLIQSLHSHNGD